MIEKHKKTKRYITQLSGWIKNQGIKVSFKMRVKGFGDRGHFDLGVVVWSFYSLRAATEKARSPLIVFDMTRSS